MSKLRLASLDVRRETLEPPWRERKYAVDSGLPFRTAHKTAIAQNLVHYICTIQVPEVPALTSVVETVPPSHDCQFTQAIYRHGKVGWPSRLVRLRCGLGSMERILTCGYTQGQGLCWALEMENTPVD
jgi:hypothetical protein